jgi:hypothetical protein
MTKIFGNGCLVRRIKNDYLVHKYSIILEPKAFGYHHFENAQVKFPLFRWKCSFNKVGGSESSQ